MLKVLLSYENKTAVFNVPHNSLEVSNYLLAAGFWKPYADLCLNYNDDPKQVQVKLIAETAADKHLQNLFPQDARLSTTNTVCDLFYRLPAEQQVHFTDAMSAGQITSETELLDTIKGIKKIEAFAPAILFSHVRVWTHEGEECQFFVGGIPKSCDDLEDAPDFEDFVAFLFCDSAKGITAYVTTFSEGDGEPQPADESDIERIYTAIAEVDIDTITGWNRIGESSFTFDYDIDELFHMGGIE